MIGLLIDEWGGYIAAFLFGAVIAGGAAYKYESTKFEKFVVEVKAAAEVAELQNKAKEQDLAKRNDAIKASYDARIAGLNGRISRLRDGAGAGSCAPSEDTATHAGFNAAAAHLIANPVVLAEACAMTTAQVVELQEYVKGVLAIYNKD